MSETFDPVMWFRGLGRRDFENGAVLDRILGYLRDLMDEKRGNDKIIHQIATLEAQLAEVTAALRQCAEAARAVTDDDEDARECVEDLRDALALPLVQDVLKAT